ncbi:MAG: hypothetical protein K0Q72_4096, partial [Armatimonadetes bacterium]|nr:hypothetical protein [Armatimonadota bacterium]
ARGLRNGLIISLEAKFGEFPSTWRAAIDGADMSLLREWLARAVQATTLEEVGIAPGAHP